MKLPAKTRWVGPTQIYQVAWTERKVKDSPVGQHAVVGKVKSVLGILQDNLLHTLQNQMLDVKNINNTGMTRGRQSVQNPRDVKLGSPHTASCVSECLPPAPGIRVADHTSRGQGTIGILTGYAWLVRGRGVIATVGVKHRH